MPRNITLEDIGRLYKDTIVQHNDNTRVLNVPYRVYNQALQRRFQNGAKQNAAWDKDPNVEVFKRGPFGITLKMNKRKLINQHNKYNGN